MNFVLDDLELPSPILFTKLMRVRTGKIYHLVSRNLAAGAKIGINYIESEKELALLSLKLF